MPKLYEPAELGKRARAHDHFEDALYPKEITELMSWYKPVYSDEESDIDAQTVKEFLAENVDIHNLRGSSPSGDFIKEATKKWFVFSLLDLIEDAGYAIWDFLSWRKVKTSLSILGGIGVGAGIGAVLGTFVLPGLGTAIGGAVGAAITTGLAAVGGVLGVSILGAVAGSFIGKKAADKLFKHEKRFQPSRRFTRKIKKDFNINTSTVDMMNGYLYNRRKAVNSKIMKKYLKKLRKNAIQKAKPEAMEQLAEFFLVELDVLEMEKNRNQRAGKPIDLQLEEEINAVKHIVRKMSYAKLSLMTKTKLARHLLEFEDRQAKGKPLPKKRLAQVRKTTRTERDIESVLTQEQAPRKKAKSTPVGPSSESLAVDEDVLSRKRSHPPNPVQSAQVRSELPQMPSQTVRNPSMLFSQTPERAANDHQTLAQVWSENFVQTLRKQGYHIAEQPDYAHCDYVSSNLHFHMDASVDADVVTTDIKLHHANGGLVDRKLFVERMVEQALAYAQQYDDKSPTVLARGDEQLAIDLIRALKAKGLSPQLAENEFPDPEKREQLTKQADTVARRHQSPKPNPKPSQV